jgi:hypothetical protein
MTPVSPASPSRPPSSFLLSALKAHRGSGNESDEGRLFASRDEAGYELAEKREVANDHRVIIGLDQSLCCGARRVVWVQPVSRFHCHTGGQPGCDGLRGLLCPKLAAVDDARNCDAVTRKEFAKAPDVTLPLLAEGACGISLTLVRRRRAGRGRAS